MWKLLIKMKIQVRISTILIGIFLRSALCCRGTFFRRVPPSVSIFIVEKPGEAELPGFRRKVAWYIFSFDYKLPSGGPIPTPLFPNRDIDATIHTHLNNLIQDVMMSKICKKGFDCMISVREGLQFLRFRYKTLKLAPSVVIQEVLKIVPFSPSRRGRGV